MPAASEFLLSEADALLSDLIILGLKSLLFESVVVEDDEDLTLLVEFLELPVAREDEVDCLLWCSVLLFVAGTEARLLEVGGEMIG
jgi:hypothetical protein